MSEETRSETYAELAAVGPYGVRPGHALITMVEPHPGHEYAYNRWLWVILAIACITAGQDVNF